MSRNPCPPNCKCGKHTGSGSRKCPDDCACGKHSAIHKKCEPDCSCGHHTEETRRAVGATWRGKTLSDEHKAKMSVTRTGKKLNLSEEQKDKWRDRANYMRQFSRMFNTKPERKLEQCLIELGIEYKKQRRIGPYMVDFIIDKHIIEMNGCYWHRCELCGYNDDIGAHDKDEKKKISALTLGYTHEVVWEHDLDQWINTMRTGERTS